MKKKLVALVLVAAMVFAFASCGSSEKSVSASSLSSISDDLTAKCKNGNFLGVLDNGVISFKGVPYAKPPLDDLRWKAPQAPNPSDETFVADKFGNTAIQYEWFSERASFNKKGEDCLTLNVWTDNLTPDKKKPVIVFIHGGAFGWGGTSDPIYSGQKFVETNKDVVFITTNYRLGMMGFIDFSNVPGGEAYQDSPNLGMLDLIQALKWINENIEAFGGDPKNITVMGESTGSVSVALLMIMDESKGLFQKAIQESASINCTNYIANFGTREKSQEMAKQLMDASGAQNMDDLLALTNEQLLDIESESCIADYGGGPIIDGKLIKEDAIRSFINGAGTDKDLLIGTNAEEYNYQMAEKGGYEPYFKDTNERFDNTYAYVDDEDRKVIDHLVTMFNDKPDEFWRKVDLLTESYYRIPAILEASYHSDNGGKTYMYNWTYPSSSDAYHKGACHAVELAYVFGNLDCTLFTGLNPNKELSDKAMGAWANFARKGDPSINGVKWPEYNTKTRDTMMIGEDWNVVSDPDKDIRLEMMKLVNKYGQDFAFVLKPNFKENDIHL